MHLNDLIDDQDILTHKLGYKWPINGQISVDGLGSPMGWAEDRSDGHKVPKFGLKSRVSYLRDQKFLLNFQKNLKYNIVDIYKSCTFLGPV